MNESDARQKLKEEFDAVFRYDWSSVIPPAIRTVVFLSAPWDETKDKSDPAYEMSAENVSRAMYTMLLAKYYGTSQTRVVLSGETEQLPAMERLVRGFGLFRPHFSREFLDHVNSGDRGKSHTGTQFITLARHFTHQVPGTVVLVTNQYHVSRVRRYAWRHFPGFVPAWHVAGIPHDTGLYQKEQKVAGEIDRIIRYAEQGIFDLFP